MPKLAEHPEGDAALRAVLKAMKSKSESDLTTLTTPEGLESLRRMARGDDWMDTLQRWTAGWEQWTATWEVDESGNAVVARFGPKDHEHFLRFVRREGRLKLDRWMPGF